MTNEKLTDKDLERIANKDNELYDKREQYKFSSYLEKAKSLPDMQRYFGNYFQTGELCILAAKTGIGKSVLAYQIADSIATGKSLLDQDNETDKQPVLLYDFELMERNTKLRYGNYKPPDNFFRPDILDRILKSNGKFDFDIIQQDILLTGASVVIIDNLSAIALRSLQDQDAALQIMKQCTLLKRQLDISILLVAHTPKLKENTPLELYDIAGSANLHNFIDNALMIGKSCKDIHTRYIKQVKSRNSIADDQVLVVKLTDDNGKGWLHYEFIGYDDESSHLELDDEKEKSKYIKLKSIAAEIIGNGSISYTQFCHDYGKAYNKTAENGKKIHRQLVQKNIIIKNEETKKWLVNGNEVDVF